MTRYTEKRGITTKTEHTELDANGDVEMATYSDHATEDEMNAAYDEYRIAEQTEAIADKMTTTRPGELPRAARLLIAAAALKAAHATAMAAFERDLRQ